MTKQELLKKVHGLIWRRDDIMDQDDLFTLQALIDAEILREAQDGTMKVEQLGNGYIKKVEVV